MYEGEEEKEVEEGEGKEERESSAFIFPMSSPWVQNELSKFTKDHAAPLGAIRQVTRSSSCIKSSKCSQKERNNFTIKLHLLKDVTANLRNSNGGYFFNFLSQHDKWSAYPLVAGW